MYSVKEKLFNFGVCGVYVPEPESVFVPIPFARAARISLAAASIGGVLAASMIDIVGVFL